MVLAESATSVKGMLIIQSSNVFMSDSFEPGFLASALISF